jgi:hypothetical protein
MVSIHPFRINAEALLFLIISTSSKKKEKINQKLSGYLQVLYTRCGMRSEKTGSDYGGGGKPPVYKYVLAFIVLYMYPILACVRLDFGGAVPAHFAHQQRQGQGSKQILAGVEFRHSKL